MAVNVAALEATLDADVRGFTRGMKKADRQMGSFERSTKSMGSKLRSGIGTLAKWGAAAGAAAGVAAAALGKKAVDAAADLNESINAVEVVFGDAAGTIKDFSDTAIDEVGLAEVKVNKAATVLGSALQGAGFEADQAADATIGLTKRAADMASVFNTDVNTALDSIQAAIRGEIDPIEKFGVSMNAASVEAKALELGLHDGSGEMTNQAKIAGRLALIMEHTERVSGDYANTQDSVANASKRFRERITELSGELGQRLLPIASDVFTFLETDGIDVARRLGNWFIDHLIPAIRSFGEFVSTSVVPAAQTFVSWFRREIIPQVVEFVAALRDNWPTVERIFDSLGRIVTSFGGIFGDTMSDSADTAAEDGESIADSVERIADALDRTLRAVATFVEGFRRAFRVLRPFLAADFTGIFRMFTDWGRQMGEAARQIAADIASGLIEGMRSRADDIVRAVTNPVGAAINKARELLGARSPSRVFAELGADTVRGFIQGVEDQETTLNQVIRDVFEQAVSGAQDIMSGLGAITGRQQAQSAVEEAQSKLSGLQSKKRNLPQQIAEAKKALKVAKEAAELVTPQEQLKILRARQRVRRAEDELQAAREEGNATSLEMAILEAEVTEAQEDLTRAKRSAKGPTDDVRAAEDRLNDLLAEQSTIDRDLKDAQNDLTRAKQSAIRAEIALVQAGQDLLDQGPEGVRMFKQMARRAGLSADEVNRMVDQTAGLASEIKVSGASRQELIGDLDEVKRAAREAAEAVGGSDGGGGGGGGSLEDAITGLPDDFNMDFLIDNSQARDALAEIREDLAAIARDTGNNIADVNFGGIEGGLVAHRGGIVPGPRGAEVPIIAQAGEQIIPLGGDGARQMVINFNAPVLGTEEEIKRMVQQAIRQEERRSGRSRL